MTRHAITPVLIAIGIAVPSLAAQTADTMKSCIAADTPLRDTTYRVMTARTDSADSGSAAATALRRAALYEVAKRVAMAAGPGRITLAVPPAWSEQASHFTLVLSTTIGVTAHTDGSLDDVRLTGESGIPAIDRVLHDAVSALDSAGKGTSRRPAGDSLRVEVRIELNPSAYSAFRMPVMRLAIASLRPTKFVELLPGQPLPHAKGSPQKGNVMVYFGVGRDGRPVPGSMQIISATSMNLSDAVLEVLPTWRFRPAEYNGCPIVWWAQQPVEFR